MMDQWIGGIMKKALLILCLFLITSCRAERSSTVPLAITPAKRQTADFAFKLYEQLAQQKGNLFFSPASIEAALAMTAEGARGNTQQQFFQTLENSDGIFPDIGNSVAFEIANAIWIDKQFSLDQRERGSVNTEQRPKRAAILENFKDTVTEKHDADIRAADFSGQPDAERVKINEWVEEKTRDKIQDLLPEGSVNTLTRMILVNAIYFKGDWLHAFDPKQTSGQLFQTLENGSVEVPMMRLTKTRFNYGENDFFQTLELPYEGEEVSMVIFLPRKKIKISDIQSMLPEAAAAPLRKTEVNVTLPRFKMESTFVSLKQHLAALGLTDAFDAQLADFQASARTRCLFPMWCTRRLWR